METGNSRPEYESYIDRESPHYPIKVYVNGRIMDFMLTYDNCAIYTHSEEYMQFDHVFVYGSDTPEQGIAIYRSNDGSFDLGEELLGLGYDNLDRNYPSIEDERRWFVWQSQDLDDFLD